MRHTLFLIHKYIIKLSCMANWSLSFHNKYYGIFKTHLKKVHVRAWVYTHTCLLWHYCRDQKTLVRNRVFVVTVLILEIELRSPGLAANSSLFSLSHLSELKIIIFFSYPMCNSFNRLLHSCGFKAADLMKISITFDFS